MEGHSPKDQSLLPELTALTLKETLGVGGPPQFSVGQSVSPGSSRPLAELDSQLMPPPPPPPPRPPPRVAPPTPGPSGLAYRTRRSVSLGHAAFYPPPPPRVRIKPKRIGPDPTAVDFCCKQKRVFSPHPIYCPCGVAIGPYHSYRSTKEHLVCEKCFSAHKTEVYISENISIKKTEFTRVVNDKDIDEPVKVCFGCRNKFHTVCLNHNDNIWPEFRCTECCLKANFPKTHPYRAAFMQESKLSNYIEAKVNPFLLRNEVRNKVFVRVISSDEIKFHVSPNMSRKYNISTPSYPYRSKLIFAFEEIDGADVAFFAFIVQEYYSNCPPPNRGQVYLSYLDSVNFFHPPQLRTRVYQSILLAYCDFVKELGFEAIHIWACPPGPNTGGNYIFYNHPAEMKIPNHSRLQNWYKKLLELGKAEGIILNFSNLYAHAAKELISSAKDMPYFDGDHWPTFFEAVIVEEEAKDSAAELGPPPKKSKKKGGKYKKRQTDEYPPTLQVDAVMSRTISEMYSHNYMFLVGQLNEHNPNKEIMDPDELDPCSMLDVGNPNLNARDVLLQFFRRYNYEFCTMRKAKWSTLGFIYEVATSDWRSCDLCHLDIGMDWYACETCGNYDVCQKCKETSPPDAHPHPLVRRYLKKSPPARILVHKKNSKIQQKNVIYKKDNNFTIDEESVILDAFIHGRSCQCPVLTPRCNLGRKLMLHMTLCKFQPGDCVVCSEMFEFAVMHFINCSGEGCSLPICDWWKNKWAQSVVWKTRKVENPNLKGEVILP